MNTLAIRAKHRTACTLAVAAVAFTSACPPAHAATIAGTWLIHGKLVTSSAMNPNDRYAPKVGQVMIETWKIAKSAKGFTLTTPKGTVPGTAAGAGGHFRVRFPANIMGAACQIQVTIDAKPKGANALVGTEEVLYFMYDGIGRLNPVPAREAWTFTAKRKR